MSQTKPVRPGRKGRATSEKIAELERELKLLKEQERKEQAQSLERNRKAIVDLFRSERLDTIDIESWRQHVPKLKALFGLKPAKDAAAKPETSALDEVKSERQPDQAA